MKSYSLLSLFCVFSVAFGHLEESTEVAKAAVDEFDSAELMNDEMISSGVVTNKNEFESPLESMQSETQNQRFMRGSTVSNNDGEPKRDLHYAKGTTYYAKGTTYYAKGTTYYVPAKGTSVVVAKGAKGHKGVVAKGAKGHKGYHTHTRTYITVKQPEPRYYGPSKGKGSRRYYGGYYGGPSKGYNRYYKGYGGYYGGYYGS